MKRILLAYIRFYHIYRTSKDHRPVNIIRPAPVMQKKQLKNTEHGKAEDLRYGEY